MPGVCVWVRCRGGGGRGLEPSGRLSSLPCTFPTSHEGTQDWLPQFPSSARERKRRGMGRDRWALIVPFTLSSLEPIWTD